MEHAELISRVEQNPWYRSPLTVFFVTLFVVLFSYFFFKYVIDDQERILLPPIPGLTPYPVSTFGPLVFTGIFFGVHQIRRWGYVHGLNDQRMFQVAMIVAFFGLICSHWVAIIFYNPEHMLDWRKMLDFRSNFSSFGGFAFGLLALLYFLKRFQLPRWPYIDAYLYGLACGWLFGRLGCFSVHDHPGLMSKFALVVPMQGVMRHDLGFYELLYTIVLVVGLSWIGRQTFYRPGLLVAISCMTYAPVRFGLDFLRIFDATYWGLTPAQWACFPLFAVGLYAWRYYHRQPV
jgi:phosphatidylglycerol:prolipoprotein diacylglycerol transferase